MPPTAWRVNAATPGHLTPRGAGPCGLTYTPPTMRFVVHLLLILLPLQWMGAALAFDCGHAGGGPRPTVIQGHGPSWLGPAHEDLAGDRNAAHRSEAAHRHDTARRHETAHRHDAAHRHDTTHRHGDTDRRDASPHHGVGHDPGAMPDAPAHGPGHADCGCDCSVSCAVPLVSDWRVVAIRLGELTGSGTVRDPVADPLRDGPFRPPRNAVA